MSQETVTIREGGDSGYPRGTRAEVIAKHLDPKVVPTCSQHIEGVNAGCIYYDHKKYRCIFSPTRNAEAGPENVGFYKKLPNGAEQGFIMPCYLFMENEFQLWQQRHITGVRYPNRFYGVGEQITRKMRVARHPKPDPDCHKCTRGQCNLMDEVKVKQTIEPFPRPEETIQGDIFPHEDELEADSGITLEMEAEHQPKVGGQVEEIMKERRAARRITENTT
jgi:hypothetical protein